jgi:hypothetical protein
LLRRTSITSLSRIALRTPSVGNTNQMETLKGYRSGAQQTVKVEHVQCS